MSAETPQISVVVPVHDEAGAAVPLAREIAAAFAGRSYEMIFVDDASKDATLAELKAAMAELPALRVLSHGTNAGQSRAVRTGVLAARGPGGGDDGRRRTEPARRRAAPGRRPDGGARRRGPGRRPPRQASGHPGQAPGLDLGQPHPPQTARRRRRRHRLRAKGLSSRRLPAPALLRSHPPLPAGADDPRRVQEPIPRRGPSTPRSRAARNTPTGAACARPSRTCWASCG